MLDRIFQDYKNDLQRFAQSLTQETIKSQDLVGETFARATENIAILENLSEAQRKSWLFRVLKNIYIDSYRKNRNEAPLPSWQEEIPGPEDDLLENLAVQELMEKLPPDLKKIVFYRYWSGMNSSEIGNLLGIPPSTVRYHLQVAMQTLRNLAQ